MNSSLPNHINKDDKDNEWGFFMLPYEIRNIIYSYFRNLKNLDTRLSIRGVCREWYNIGLKLKKYNNKGDLLYNYSFTKNIFRKTKPNGFVVKKIVFEPYGKFKSVEYDEFNKLKKIIFNNPPFELNMIKKKYNTIEIRKCNIKTGINSTEHRLNGCMSHFNPFLNDPDFIVPSPINHPHIGVGIDEHGNPQCQIS